MKNVKLWGIAAGIFAAEFFIKGYCKTHLEGISIPIVPNIFHITVVFNTGAAFGTLYGQTSLLIGIGVIFLLVFWALMRKEQHKSALFLYGCALLMGGAVSNLYDRIVYGYVIDYLDFRVWPVFNIADSCITMGAGLLMLHSWVSQRHDGKRNSGPR